MFKKLTLTLLASVILFTSSLGLFAKSAQAQWYKPTYDNFVGLVEGDGNDSELFGERYTAAQVRWILWSLVYIITENPLLDCYRSVTNVIIPIDYEACSTVFSALVSDSSINSSQSSGFASIFSSPISSTYYFKQIGYRLKIVPEVHAQGFGFEAASIVFNLWEMSRNIAYSLLIIVIIIMAFMIMFRVKLSPQTVISVQSALPKVITTLILITFSYAIAGLMIDLMYVAMGLLTTILLSGGLSDMEKWGDLFAELTSNTSALELMMKYVFMFMGAIYAATITSVSGILATVFSAGLYQPVIIIVTFIVCLILAFKTWWMLLKNFVMIIMSIAFAPFQILIGALGSGGFGPWAKNLAGLLAVYPVTAFMFVLSFVFLRGATSSLLTDFLSDLELAGFTLSDVWPFDVANVLAGSNNWVPPMTANAGDLNMAWLGVSLAILALIPKTAEMIKGFMTGRPLAYGSAIGENLAVGGALGWGAAQYASTKQKSSYEVAQATAKAAGTTVSAGAERINRVAGFFRGASGGRIK